MNDTATRFEELVTERHRQMTPRERLEIASAMFDTARAIIESSLTPGLSRRERRLEVAKRLYAGELPEAALIACAEWPE
jgi:hypothetical protein